jgi:hypothetical protein
VVADFLFPGEETAPLKYSIGFRFCSCSWPRPVHYENGVWLSQPEWDAPEMPDLPQLRYEEMEGRVGVVIDWCEFFRGNFLTFSTGGEMRGFHVAFRIRIEQTGTFVFWDDDGSIVRRDGVVVHEDRRGHPLERHSIEVREGDLLEFAQWQDILQWAWKGCLQPAGAPAFADALLPYLPRVRERLLAPNGPALKMMTNGSHAVRAALSVYSMVLNGYSPARVLLYGEHQWTPEGRQSLAELMPFAEVVTTDRALSEFEKAAGPAIRLGAAACWWVFKACIAVYCAPRISCLMDDDFVILDDVSDALREFETHDLVYCRDCDYGEPYARGWGYSTRKHGPLPTGEFNAGLYWVRPPEDTAEFARLMRRRKVDVKDWLFHIWEQGFIAVAFARLPTFGLPSQRYLFPRFDGLPGDVFGYDYVNNPCGFASIHFGGMGNKPGDATAAMLAADVLAPRTSLGTSQLMATNIRR